MKYTKITEFIFNLYLPITEGKKYVQSNSRIFYNKRMVFDREYTMEFVKKIKSKTYIYIDSMASTGIRGFYMSTLNTFEKIYFIDTNNLFIPTINYTIQNNENLLKIKNKLELYNISFFKFPFYKINKNTIVDVDCFGSPIIYLKPLLERINIKYLKYVFLTATDIINLCSIKRKERVLTLYNVKIEKVSYYKELGYRILISKIDTIFRNFNIGYSIISSYCRIHYYRFYIQILNESLSENRVKDIFFCSYCEQTYMNPKKYCINCYNPTLKTITNIYTGPITYSTFFKKDQILNNIFEIGGFKTNRIFKYLKKKQLRNNKILEILMENKYVSYFSKMDNYILKTNCSSRDLYSILNKY